MPKEQTAKPLEEIELLKPHEHAGREYPAGARLNLALHQLDLDAAAWLIGIAVAKQVDPILAVPATQEGA